MRKIKIFWNLNELAHWNEVFIAQLNCMINSGLREAADEIVLMGNGRERTFSEILKLHPDLKLVMVAENASLHEFSGLSYIHQCAQQTEEPYHILYIHMKGLTRWGNPYIEDWKAWLNWCVIERWQDNINALQAYDTSGPNWDPEPWPHYSGNFWWATRNHILTLPTYIGERYTDPELWIQTVRNKIYSVYNSGYPGGGLYSVRFPRYIYENHTITLLHP